ncbi:unnamed protein product [Porites evermanni]|uniref:G-protein coupled receptors family 3 profile domain-containing protein n=1 Tax=Porites evermanni TaxID=104178 RepID=A0ABN8LTD8_9CNID|nr:unnamed protein product [Porites evermanni]
MLGGLFSLQMGSKFSAKEFGRAEATIFAIDMVNKNSSLLPNVSIGYDIRNFCDSRVLVMQETYDFKRNSDPVCMCKSNSSMSTKSSFTKRIESKHISALIGTYNSASAVLVGSLLQVADIPVVSATATSVELSSEYYKDFFRTVPSDTWVAKAMADIIEHFNWTYVAAIGLDDSYGRNGILALERESYNRETFCIAFNEFIPRLDYHDNMEQIVARIKKHRKIGVIIVWLYGKYFENFFAVATKKGLQGKTLIMSEGGTIEERFLSDPRFTILNGSLIIESYDYPSPAFEKHVKSITPAESAQRDEGWWREFWRLEFNGSMAKSTNLGNVTCKANHKLDQALSKLRSPFVSYVIDSVYAIAYALDNIYRCNDKQGLRNTGSCPSVQPTIKGRDLQKYLRNVSFDGLTGKVRFDRFGDPFSALYSIINVQRSPATEARLRKVTIGTWNKDSTPKLKLNTSNLRWKTLLTPVSSCSTECMPGTRKEPTSTCCWDCVKCPQGTISAEIGSKSCTACEPDTKPNNEGTRCEKLPIVNISLTTAGGMTLTVVASIGFILTMLVCRIYIKFHNSPIVRASNREISFLLLFGISGLHILAILDLSESSNILCIAATFWRYFTLNLCVTVLFTKTMRITSVFGVDKVAQLFTPCYKTLERQIIFTSVVNLVPTSLLGLWMSTDPPGREKIIRSDEYIFLLCKPYYTNTGFALFITVSCYIITVALLCTYYAFKGRGIPENFNETKYIGFSMYILLLSSIAYYPVAFTFESWYVTLVSCLTTLVTSFGLLGCMFGPKVFILLFCPQQNTVEHVRSQVWNFSFDSVAGTRGPPKPVNVGTPNPALEPENGRVCTSKL